MSKPVLLDKEAVTGLYTEHRQAIFRLCLAYLRDPHEADEAVQDTFLKALKKSHTYGGDASPLAWLRRIAVNVCLDRLRSFSWKVFRRGSEIPEIAGESSLDEDLASRDLLERLREGMAALPSKQRMVFVLRFYEELSLEEIAEVMGSHVGTVKRHLYRALDRLRSMGETL